MISQYKREEEEQNKYVDPLGNEFKYAPTGMAPTLNTSTLVDVPSLGAPATVVDVSKEKNNYAKIYQDIQNAKQEIKNKKEKAKKKKKKKPKKRQR
jgi:hypothetical protein